MKKFFFETKSNSPIDRIGQYGYQLAWTDKCQTKKEVKERYSSKTSRGNKVLWVMTEEQFVEKYGEERAAKVNRYVFA